MLNHIHIQNIALIESLSLDLNQGLTVLTGETGAGKSILVDALGFVLGNRADSDLLRHGADRAEVTVQVNIEKLPKLREWLQNHDMDSDDECLVRRVLNKDGRSRCYINGHPCNLKTSRELTQQLIEIHGQQTHQALSTSERQRELLDLYAQNSKHCQAVSETFHAWQENQKQLEALNVAASDKNARLEFLQYQVEELDKLQLQENELPQLEKEHKTLAHTDELILQCQQALANLGNENHSAVSLVEQTTASVQHAKSLLPELQTVESLLDQATLHLNEAVAELQSHIGHLEVDPQRLNEVEQRLSAINDLARKHRIQPETLVEFHQSLLQQLADMQSLDNALAQCQAQQATLLAEYQKAADALSKSRKQAASHLTTAITEHIQALGMPHGKLNLVITPLQDKSEPHKHVRLHGQEQISFEFSANPGQPLKPLDKVASGGELSRISLAIYVSTAKVTATPCLIFDEVDTGISGATAAVVGQLLQKVGQASQALCVTHLAQVASCAHHHWQISKHSEANSTRTTIQALDHQGKVEEIARLLGGVKITQQTRAHAAEMLQLVEET